MGDHVVGLASKACKHALKVIHCWLRKLHRSAIRRPTLTLMALALILVASTLGLGQLRMLMSIDDLADPDFATYDQLKSLKKNFLDQDELYAVIRRKDGELPTKAELCSLSSWIQTTSDNRADIKAIVSTLGVVWPVETADTFQALPLLNIDCTDPAKDESEAIKKGLAKIAQSPWRGTLTSHQGNDVAVLIYPAARHEASFFGTFDHQVIDDLEASLTKGVLEKNPNLEASWIGDGIFQYHLRKGYESMPLLNLLMSLIVIVLFRYYLGTFKSSFIFLQLVVWVSLPVYAGMALAGHPIDTLSSSLSLMIFVSSLEDFLILSHFMRNWSWRKAFDRVLLPSFFTSLTTTIGFGSLVFADLGIIRRFGLWAAVGAALEWIVLFAVFPAVIVKFPQLQNWVLPKQPTNKAFEALLTYKPGRWVTRTAMLVFPFAIMAAHQLHVSDSPEKLLKESHPTRQAVNVIEQTRGWRSAISLIFQDSEKEAFNREVLANVSRWPLVDQIEDAYHVRDFLTGHLSPEMRNFIMSYVQTDTIGHRLGPSDGQSRAIVYLKGLDIVDVNKMRSQVSELCPKGECWLAGSLVSYGELGDRVLGTLYESLGISLILVGGILAFISLAVRPSAFWPLLLSAMWGPAALLVIFYIFRIPVFYVTSMIATILVGLAGDNAIQFLFFSARQGMQKSVTQVGPAALLISLSMIATSAVFFFGYFDPMRTLGLMLIVGVALAFLGDVWILRGLSQDH